MGTGMKSHLEMRRGLSKMRQLLLVCGAVLCLSLSAVAQVAPPGTPTRQPTASAPMNSPERQPWQLGVGYQYQHYDVLGQSFGDNGIDTNVARYLNNWFAAEGAVTLGFGNTGKPLNLSAKSLFAGGGPHVVLHSYDRFDPWVHVLVGVQHFRFTQRGPLGSNSALGFMAGAGVDYKIRDRVYWRIQGDYIGTHFQSSQQTNYSFGTGLVFNF